MYDLRHAQLKQKWEAELHLALRRDIETLFSA